MDSNHTTTVAATESSVAQTEDDNTGKFYSGYMARVAELQKMTQEANMELALIDDSDEDVNVK